MVEHASRKQSNRRPGDGCEIEVKQLHVLVEAMATITLAWISPPGVIQSRL